MYKAAAILSLLLTAASANAGVIRITEYMYTSSNGNGPTFPEFVEICNVDSSPQDMNGWSFDDNSRSPGSFSLTPLGTLAAGQCGIITETTAASFRTIWNLDAGIPIAASNNQNLGRGDEINIYDDSNALVDRLTYDDQNIGGSIRTNGRSGWAPQAALGVNNILLWNLSSVGDSQNSYTSVSPSAGDIGSPGAHVVPEPTTLTLLVFGFAAVAFPKRGLKVRRA